MIISDHACHISHVDKVAKLVSINNLNDFDLNDFSSGVVRFIRVSARHSVKLSQLLSLVFLFLGFWEFLSSTLGGLLLLNLESDEYVHQT